MHSTLQSDYQSEAISFDSITFTDNKACVDLLEDQTGLFALINEVDYIVM